MPPRTPIRIELSEPERCELERAARAQCAPHREVIRAKVILRLAEGHTVSAIGREVGLERRILRKWAERFQRKRLQGLQDNRSERTAAPLFPPSSQPIW